VASAFLAAVLTDPTLTGRTEIWLYLTEVYRERPWLGHGFGQTDLSWRLPFHCHNQLLTLLLGVGAVGCWLFLTDALLAFRASLMHADGQWATVYLAFLAVAGLTEQVPFEAPSLFFALYVFAGSATEATGERATLLRET
jgi:O-antigen ligase